MASSADTRTKPPPSMSKTYMTGMSSTLFTYESEKLMASIDIGVSK